MADRRTKIVFFDWHDTLSQSLFWDHLKDREHPRHEWYGSMAQALLFENKPLVGKWMRGQVTKETVARFLSECLGYPAEIILEDLGESCRNMRFVLDDLPVMIGRLRSSGMKCVVATDNMDTFREHTIPGMGLRDIFDDFLISSELGVLKHDIDRERGKIPFFDPYLERKGVSYDQVVLVDDSMDDGFYARKGFRILQVDGPESLRKHIGSVVSQVV